MTINCAFINMEPIDRYVHILGKRLQLIYQGETTLTWSGEFESSTVLVQFQEGSLFPWSAQVITNKVTEHSSGYVDVLQVEKWVEYQLTGIRQTIKKFTPQPQSPMSNITNVPRGPKQPSDIVDFKSTNRYVKLFGGKMPLVRRSNTCWTWSADFGPITVSVQFQEGSLFPWVAQIENGKVLEHSSGYADVLQVEKWVEDQLTAIRQTITALIPEIYHLGSPEKATLPKEEVPVLLGMKLEWEPFLEQWTLPESLYGLRIQKTNHGKYVGHLELNFEEAPLHEVVSKFDSLFKTITKSDSIPKNDRWCRLPETPFELPCFAVRNKKNQHFVILKAANPQGDVHWYTHTEKLTPSVVSRMTWHKITQDFDEYLEIPS